MYLSRAESTDPLEQPVREDYYDYHVTLHQALVGLRIERRKAQPIGAAIHPGFGDAYIHFHLP